MAGLQYFGVFFMSMIIPTGNAWLDLQILSQSPSLVYSSIGKVGSGNFTYFKLHKTGNLQLLLKTIDGDADFYISSVTQSPDYHNYELKSASFGDETVEVSYNLKRPIYIGVYGHPGIMTESSFELKVYSLDVDSVGGEVGDKQETDEEEPETFMWMLFINTLQVIFDILI